LRFAAPLAIESNVLNLPGRLRAPEVIEPSAPTASTPRSIVSQSEFGAIAT